MAVVQLPYRYLTIAGILLTLLTCYGVKTAGEYLADSCFVGKAWMLQSCIGICLIAVCILEASSSDTLSMSDYHAEGDVKYCTISNAGEDGYVELPIFSYAQLKVTDTGTGQTMQTSAGEKGRLRVEIPAGFSGTLQVYFQVPALWRVSEAVSLLSVLGCAAAVYRQRRKSV